MRTGRTVKTHEQLREQTDRVRSVLNILEADLGADQHSAEGARDLGHAVDDLRRTVWAVLTARHSGDYDSYLARIRVRRAAESCEDVLAELYAGTLLAETPGLFTLYAALSEILGLQSGEQR